MPDQFDPYREALVVETRTLWPDSYDYLEAREKRRLEAALHAEPAKASHLEYIRLHSGFCRQIVVTEDDLARAEA
jgi:hypothetical protein